MITVHVGLVSLNGAHGKKTRDMGYLNSDYQVYRSDSDRDRYAFQLGLGSLHSRIVALHELDCSASFKIIVSPGGLFTSGAVWVRENTDGPFIANVVKKIEKAAENLFDQARRTSQNFYVRLEYILRTEIIDSAVR